MKRPQEHKKKSDQEYLKLIKDLRESKDIDKIADLFLLLISMYGLTMDEVAALNYYVTERTIKAPHNAQFIKERLDLDVTELGPEGILQIQRSLVSVYVDKIKK